MGSKRIVVIGAGMGGLSTAAVLARLGHSVTVLEAHIYPGGVAGTFYHQGYRFDAGATLAAGFYPGGPMDLLGKSAGVDLWPVEPLELAMKVHLPNRPPITRWSDRRRWDERRKAFGEESLSFWNWQERTADLMWNLATQVPPWPPQTLRELRDLVSIAGRPVLSAPDVYALDRLNLIPSALGSIDSQLTQDSPALRAFVDAQLLISAQTTSANTNALYGAAALDLPRRGVAQPLGGMGELADQLARALERNGGRIHYRNRVARIVVERGRPIALETDRNAIIPAETVVANIPEWSIAQMMGDQMPLRLRKAPPHPRDGWGAAIAYIGLDESVLETDQALHHQIVTGHGWGEGDSIYLSVSPASDASRAPDGKRSITLSTHTRIGQWQELRRNDRSLYEEHRNRLMQKMLKTAEHAIPGLREAADLVVPGTPASFERFTGRPEGWVGGYPQTSLFRTRGARIAPGIWMVGDSIFPGQSVAATALGGLRVARAVNAEIVRESHGRRLWVLGKASRRAAIKVD